MTSKTSGRRKKKSSACSVGFTLRAMNASRLLRTLAEGSPVPAALTMVYKGIVDSISSSTTTTRFPTSFNSTNNQQPTTNNQTQLNLPCLTLTSLPRPTVRYVSLPASSCQLPSSLTLHFSLTLLSAPARPSSVTPLKLPTLLSAALLNLLLGPPPVRSSTTRERLRYLLPKPRDTLKGESFLH